MKVLFENWRNFLKEADPYAKTSLAKPAKADPYAKTPLAKPAKAQSAPPSDEYSDPFEDPRDATREKYFGKNPDDLKCIQDLRKPIQPARSTEEHQERHARVADFFDCMENSGYNKIGEGSFRAVFAIPGKPDLVLKTPSPEHALRSHNNRQQSMEMNREEAEGAFQTASDLVPKVYDSARDYFWIVSEKVNVIDNWGGMSQYFPVWKDLVSSGIFDSYAFGSYFYDIIDAMTRERRKDDLKKMILSRLLHKLPRDEQKNIEQLADDIVKKLLMNSMFANIRDFLAQFKLPSWDIRPHNVGYAIRDGKKQFVILDPGFGLEG